MRTFIISLVAAVLMLAGTAHARNPLFVTNIDFAPYSMLTQGKAAGIDVDVMNEAAKRAGISIDIEFKTWDELVSMVEKGECDGAFSMFRTPEREKTAFFADAVPLHHSDYVLFTKISNKFSFRNYDDLAGKIIGMTSGTDLGEEFAKARAAGKINIKEYADISAAIKGLIMGEIDAYAGNLDVTSYRLKIMGMSNSIVYLPKKILEMKPAYIVLSRASKLEEKELILQKLEIALDRMRKDGTYNKLARFYLVRY